MSTRNPIDQAYYDLTGLNYSITDVINNCSTEEEQNQISQKINWMVKNGLIRTSPDFISQAKTFVSEVTKDTEGVISVSGFAEKLLDISDFDDIYDASIDDVKYKSLLEAVNAAVDGCTIKVLLDLTFETRVDCNVNATYTIDLNGHTLTPTVTCTNGSAIRIFVGNVTLINGTIDGSEIDGVTNTQALPYGKEVDLVDVKPGATLTIDTITAKVNSATGCCFYGWSNKTGDSVINVLGGTYTNIATTADKSGFMDMVFNQGDTANQCIFVKGGTFYGSDPKIGDNAKKCTSFMAEGYTTIQNSDGSWKAISIPNTGIIDPEYPYND